MSSKWSSVAVLPPLENDEVHLWRINLADAGDQIGRFSSFLSADEQITAGRYRIAQARDHFTIGRACVRILLGNALGVDSSHLNIAKGLHGKPEISTISGEKVAFNVAHSQNTVLIALGRQGAVGVDVEYLDRATDIMEVARGNFTGNESNSLAAISDPETRRKTFYNYWTRKEAIGKADGRGLLLPMTSFDVAFESMDSQPVQVTEPSKEGKLYFVTDIDLEDRAAGALALESAKSRVRTFLFPLASSW